MEGTGKQARYAPVLVFLLGIAVLLPGVWSETGVTGKDEYWLSFRTPMEMLERDSWLTPWVDGRPRLKKPPLLYWGILLTYKAFGIHPFSARIWAVLSGAGLALCATLLYQGLFRRSGMLAGLIALSTLAVAVEGRRAMFDLPLAALTGFAVYFAVCWGRTGGRVWILAAALCLGLSVLAKGPVGLMFFAAAALTALWVFRRWRWAMARWRQVLGAAILFFLVSLPWPLAMAHLWPGFLSTVGEEIGTERLGKVFLGSPFSALGGTLGLVFPWSLVMLGAIIGAFGRGGDPETRGRRMWLALWCLAGVVPFFFMRSFGRYMIPIAACACVLCAEWLETYRGPWRARVLRATVLLLAAAAATAACFALWFRLGVAVPVSCLALAGVMIRFVYPEVRPVPATAAAVILFACLMGGLYPSLGIGYMPPGISALVGELPAAVYKGSQPSMLSMRLKRSVVELKPETLGDAFRVRGFDGVVFMEGREAAGFEQISRSLGIRFERMGGFRTFYSRKAWARFAREGAEAGDWKTALLDRSLEPLKTEILYYRASPGTGKNE